MKRLNLSYINVICVFVLSFAVMEYVNLLIGRVGGFPVLAGVLVSYSVMRYGSFARKNMACYMGIYILTWFIGTVVLFITVSGKIETITVSMSTIAKKYPHISDRVEPYSALKYCAGPSFLILPQPEYFAMNNTTVPINHVSI